MALDPAPSVARPRTPASLLRAGLAARALGLRLHRAVAHRVRGLHGHPDDRDARLLVHQHQPRPGRAAAVRRAEELRDAAPRPAGLDFARHHAQVRRAGAAGRGHRCRSSSRSCSIPGTCTAAGALPGPVLPALRRAVRGRRLHLGRDAQPEHGLDQRWPSRRSVSRTRRRGSRIRRGSTRALRSSGSGASAPG